MKILFVGGGTGGHIYPAIAVAQAVQDKIIDSQILFVGSEEGIETKIIPKERFSLVTIKSRGMLRKLSYKAISAPFLAIAGFFQSLGIIRTFKPDIIVATGGFVSLPVTLAGFFLRVPVILHEGNITPGLSTRICKWFASCVTIAFETSRKYYKWKKVYYIGGPVRREILSTVKGIAIQNLGLRQDKKVVLVLGGSQGARSINKILVEALGELSKLDIQVIHVCGERDFDWITTSTKDIYPFYHRIPYMYNIWDGLAAADIVVSRAGATVISEILARGVPSILIPFPFSAERHQDHNAEFLANAGAAVILKDDALNRESLTQTIRTLLNDKELYLKMKSACGSIAKTGASNDLVDIIAGILGINLYERKRKNRSK